MLSDGTIRKLLETGEIWCTTPSSLKPKDHQIQPASLDLSLGDVQAPYLKWADGGGWRLEAGQHTLACTAECVGLSDQLVGRVEGKSTWARRGLLIHAAGFIDPGFKGQITLELKNLGHKPIYLHPGDMIAQVCFDYLDAPAIRPYGSEGLNSHYQGQSGIRAAHDE